MTRDETIRNLVQIGEQAIVKENNAALDAYFAPDYQFHGPTGDLDYPGLRSYFAAERAAFSDFTIKRAYLVVESDFIACQTTFSGVFTAPFTQSPVGTLQPTGQRFTQVINNIFRFNDDGRLAEEWVQYDVRGFLEALGAPGR